MERHKQILGWHKNVNTVLQFQKCGRKTKVFIAKFHKFWGKDLKKKVFISKYARIFTNSWVKTKCRKNGPHLKKCANFHEIWGETTKKGTFSQNLQKTVLAHEFLGDNQYFGSLRPQTALQWHQACYFL